MLHPRVAPSHRSRNDRVSHGSEMQRIVALSTSEEAKHFAAGKGVKEAVVVVGSCGVLSVVRSPETNGASIKVLEDNEGAM